MTAISALTTAISGLRAASKRADAAAGNIANLDTPGYRTADVRTTTLRAASGLDGGAGVQAQIIAGDEGVDLAREAVRLIEAELAYGANAAVFRTAEELSREAIDLTA